MDLTEAIYGRRATRAYTAAPVPKEVLKSLVDAAVQAPSAVNEQPWDFTIIQNTSLLDRISAAAKAHMIETMPSGSFPEHLHETLGSPDFHIFYHAPVLITVSARAGGWAIENATLAAENLMLAAHGQGLGSCWIGFAQRWLETADGKRALGVSDDFVPVAPIIIGYPTAPIAPVPRHAPQLRWID
ncbi:MULTISPECIES: nitroreductase family protein [unclassified Sphingobium]|uniref:nitroreductase family protein n=1 Tax=unclassified Sphingobium TaxID=2611147 RepID=UPI000447756D|nr:nitroreductase [Sphingobium sp. Ant17]EXS68574.1 nitroreductase [Sphingobium sp. Ant17]